MIPVPGFDLDDATVAICASENLTLVQPLGHGSYKHVYLVQDNSGDNYALKVILNAIPSPRTAREISSLLRCNHPSIAKLVKVGDIHFQGCVVQFILEEYLPGGTLTARINQLGNISQTTVLQIGSYIIDALEHLRKLTLVHRDIKPDNIMFRDDSDLPVLVDFGCVRDLSASSLTQDWMHQGPGTPYFASPEQLNNQKLLTDWRSDQFSLGVTLFFSHTQSHPYQYPGEPIGAPDTVERVVQRGNLPPTFLTTVRQTPLAPLERMVAAWPVQRYRTPTELLVDWIVI